MKFSEDLIKDATQEAYCIDGLLASCDPEENLDLDADEWERAELQKNFLYIAAAAMDALNTMEQEAEDRRKWEADRKTKPGFIIKEAVDRFMVKKDAESMAEIVKLLTDEMGQTDATEGAPQP